MKKIVEDNLTYEELSIILKQMFPNNKGLSVRSLQRYCSSENIHRTSRLNDLDLNDVVLTSVLQVSIDILSVRSMEVLSTAACIASACSYMCNWMFFL